MHSGGLRPRHERFPGQDERVIPRAFLRFRRPLIFAVHLLLIPVGYFAAFALRFDLAVPPAQVALFWATLAFLLPIRLASFAGFGLLRGWWRHVGVRDLMDLVQAVTISSAGLLAVVFLTSRLDGFPRSIVVLDWIISIFMFGGIRFAVRVFREQRNGDWGGADRRATPALVVGAGDAAERLLRQLRHGGGEFRAIGLVDDDTSKRGMRLHGVEVLGTTEDLPRLAHSTGAKLIVIAVPSASRDEMQQIVGRCLETKVEFRIVPPLHELLDGTARVSQVRRVQVEDLLGRDAVELDLDAVRAELVGRTVMVTGGAGSIGSELARQVAGFGAGKLVLVEQAESGLYFVDLELRRHHPGLEIVPIVGDITDRARMEDVFRTHRPEYVFHAAAYKHVPLMEANPVEAVRNNVFGTLCVAECAAEFGADKFVLISTDKAVRPSSVMGATKRVAERIVLGWPALRASSTDFRAVRFGNVLGSDGSVIPLFRKQLARGGPLTVTHPEVSRYFMTIPEAVQLVLQATQLPEAARRISMLEMGEPVRILELAENLVRLSGLEPYHDVPIVFTGLRPGEKLYEELMTEVEDTVPTSFGKIRIVQTDEVNGVGVERAVDRLGAGSAAAEAGELLGALCAMVPECVAPLRDRGVPVTGESVRGRGRRVMLERASPAGD